ncbi:beta-lactamase family protein [Aquiflexum sp. TKW24L]|uniref:serine hydrolase domain-containing protein n=1 Tax=Aquiflexum sp. TKW24L TaxID=2942212 RepID=UPI0020BFD0FD|nr:serine hydrolase domain-containing protein [Aquiflexum sp. TKW24L]MCL6259421.1 beta-lactamase family protein [Aquiflexum sp. TKW24L]
MKQRSLEKICFGLMFWFIISPFVSNGQQIEKITNNVNVASNILLLETWLQTQIRYGKIPGVSVGIVYDGELIYQKGFGYADTDKKILSTADTRYRIASQSKIFTAIGIMILRDEGKLNLDEPIEKYLTWLKLKQLNESDPPITIRQLLTHSSGMSRDISTHWTDFDFPTQEEFRKLANTHLEFVYSPYTKWKYSNNGYTLLGEIIEAVSGKTYSDFITERILLPLNMSSTKVIQDEDYQSTLAVGYGRILSNGQREKFGYVDARATAPMAGLSSSVTDLSKFISWQMRLLYQNKTEILSPNTLKEMYRTHFIDEDWRWGLGFSIYQKGMDQLIGASGLQLGYRTSSTINPKDKMGVIVCINSIDGEAHQGTQWSVSERIYEWLTPAIKNALTVPIQTDDTQNFKEFEGMYENIWSESYVIFVDGSLKIITPYSADPKNGAMVLEPISENNFKIITAPRYKEVGETITFKKDAQGKVIGYTLGFGTELKKMNE